MTASEHLSQANNAAHTAAHDSAHYRGSELEARLRAALASTSLQAPRPTLRLEMPAGMEHLLNERLLASLRPAAVLAPVIRRGRELSMLLTVRSSELRSHAGQISFPGGRRDEADLDAIANALREAEEEIGLPPQCVEVIGFLDDYPTLSRYLVTPVVGIVEDAPPLRMDSGEVAEIFEVPLDYALDPRSFQQKLLGRDGLQLPFYELQWQQHRIWGATAGMLWDLANRVQAV